jgi:hypothetical protein
VIKLLYTNLKVCDLGEYKMPPIDNDGNQLNPEEETNTPEMKSEDIEKIVKARLDEQLSSIKEKLDNAYSQRDEAVAKAVAFEEERKKLAIQSLEEEGRHKEAADLKIAELTAQLDSKTQQVVTLTRDNAVRESLKGLDFKNDTAADFAYRDVVNQLVQDENGKWVHKTGSSIKDYVDSFRKDEDKEFLFKPKQSSGTGQPPSSTTNGNFDKTKSISEMTTEEIMQAAAAGHFDSSYGDPI